MKGQGGWPLFAVLEVGSGTFSPLTRLFCPLGMDQINCTHRIYGRHLFSYCRPATLVVVACYTGREFQHDRPPVETLDFWVLSRLPCEETLNFAGRKNMFGGTVHTAPYPLQPQRQNFGSLCLNPSWLPLMCLCPCRILLCHKKPRLWSHCALVVSPVSPSRRWPDMRVVLAFLKYPPPLYFSCLKSLSLFHNIHVSPNQV